MPQAKLIQISRESGRKTGIQFQIVNKALMHMR